MIELDGVVKSYGSVGREARALGPVDLRIGPGEAVCVLGRSGSGKTTLIDIVATLLRPSAGRYRFAGRDLGGASERELAQLRNRHFGFVFQAFHLLPDRSVLENVLLPGRYRRGPSLEPAARRQLDALGLGAFTHRRPAELSGGQRQRVAIARALVAEPEVLLADEPTGNLDADTGAEVVELLFDVARAGRTLILVTHDRELAVRFPRRIELADGQLVQ